MSFAPGCTPPPPRPADGSSDWSGGVHPNCFSNLARLGIWIGGTTTVQHGQSPSVLIKALAPQSVAAEESQSPFHVYVVTHGWAPGYRGVVNAAGGKLRWWENGAESGGLWPSDWAWAEVSGNNPRLTVNPTGLLQAIVAHDPGAIPFVYSWLDDSATDGGWEHLDQVYLSEAYTTINGMRLANALEEVLHDSFWSNPANRLHLIGHSHGSKVVTVAAYILGTRGHKVDHLTLLDAPESRLTRQGDGANFLPLYLTQMALADPGAPSPSGTFVDNYASYFGVSYAGAANLAKIVEVMLDPSKLYDADDIGGQHTYAAGWYGGAAKAATTLGLQPLGLGWPPPWKPYLPALNQIWPRGTPKANRWPLSPGTPLEGSQTFGFPALHVDSLNRVGNVTGDPVSGLVFGAPAPGSGLTYSEFEGGYKNSIESSGYGVAFDVEWSAPQDGDYLVVTAQSSENRVQEVLLVMDGKSAPAGKLPAAIGSDLSNVPFFDLDFYVFYFPAAGNSRGTVRLSNFRTVTVS